MDINLNSDERNYLFNLISLRLFELQSKSFLFSGERIFLETLLSKLGFVLEFDKNMYISKFFKKTINSDK